MKNLHQFVGHIVHLRPANFKILWKNAQKKGQSLENLFLVSAFNKKKNKLICYGAGLCLLVTPSDVVLA